MQVRTFLEYALYLIAQYLGVTFLAPFVISTSVGLVVPLLLSSPILIGTLRCLTSGESIRLDSKAQDDTTFHLFFAMAFLIGSLYVYYIQYSFLFVALVVIFLTTVTLTAQTSEEELQGLSDILTKGFEKGPLSRNPVRTIMAFALSMAFILFLPTFWNSPLSLVGIVYWGIVTALSVLTYSRLDLDQEVSKAWYLLPVLFWIPNTLLGVVGGVIAWFANRKRNPKKARNLLVFGIILTVSVVIIVSILWLIGWRGWIY